MKRDKKYLEAAEVICTNIHPIGSRSCCLALTYVGKSATRFNELFTPHGCSEEDYYFDDKKRPDKHTKLARSLALILMYEMGEK